MLAPDLIRAFCQENNYEVCENYAKTFQTPFGDEAIAAIGIAVRKDDDLSPMAVATELALRALDTGEGTLCLEGLNAAAERLLAGAVGAEKRPIGFR